MAMTAKGRAMREAGISVISLTIGEPDFASPPHAIEAAHQAALRGETKYTPQDGVPALKQAIQRKFLRDSGLEFGLDQITVSAGGKQVIFNALLATLDEGDEVVIPAPYWGAYPLMVRLVGGVPVAVNCPENNGFKLRPEDLDAVITPRTKWLILNFPNNPTGAACSAAEMAALGEVMLRHPACVDHVRRHVRASGVRRFPARHHGGGAAGVAGSRLDCERRVQDLRDDGLASGLRRWGRVGW